MPIQVDTFVDPHCHMFTVADVPLHKTISEKIKHPLFVLFGGALVGFGYKKFEPFVKFFDQESIQNVAQIVEQLEDALTQVNLGDFEIEATETILTPLIMDFDKNGEVEKFDGQVKRLKDAAIKYGEDTDKKVKVLPFIGLDPRNHQYGEHGERLNPEQIKAEIATFLKNHGVIDENTNERYPRTALKTGDIMGVKLYPPLGFDVYPDDEDDRAAYLAVYEKLAELQVPVTVHCQVASYNLSRSQKGAFTSPENWRKVLETNETLATLRINFGHFGGETGVADAVNWSDGGDDSSSNFFATGPSHVGWTSEIIKLLQRYENTYADISAFDYRKDKCAASLLWLLAHDKAGKLKKTAADVHSITGKLMWGSDYPMILEEDYPNYQRYFKDFIESVINLNAVREKNNSLVVTDYKYSIPNDDDLPLSASELLKVLVGDNPVKFLFG